MPHLTWGASLLTETSKEDDLRRTESCQLSTLYAALHHHTHHESTLSNNMRHTRIVEALSLVLFRRSLEGLEEDKVSHLAQNGAHAENDKAVPETVDYAAEDSYDFVPEETGREREDEGERETKVRRQNGEDSRRKGNDEQHAYEDQRSGLVQQLDVFKRHRS